MSNWTKIAGRMMIVIWKNFFLRKQLLPSLFFFLSGGVVFLVCLWFVVLRLTIC